MALSSAARANQALRELWERERSVGDNPLLQLWPLQYPELDADRVAFVGINPSHVEANAAVLRLAASSDLRDPARLQRVIALDERALGRNGVVPVPYYQPLALFFEDAPAWVHLDVFAVRHPKQQAVVDAFCPGDQLTELGEAQVRIFEELLAALSPRVIVVINAFASRLVRLRFRDRLRFDDARGYHFCTIGGADMPVFFSAMLSGQRALDVHSRERLVWHVRAALKEREALRVRGPDARPASDSPAS